MSSDSVEKNTIEKSKNDKEYENDAVDNYEKDKWSAMIKIFLRV